MVQRNASTTKNKAIVVILPLSTLSARRRAAFAKVMSNRKSFYFPLFTETRLLQYLSVLTQGSCIRSDVAIKRCIVVENS